MPLSSTKYNQNNSASIKRKTPTWSRKKKIAKKTKSISPSNVPQTGGSGAHWWTKVISGNSFLG